MDQAQPATPNIGPDLRQDLQFVRAAVERGAHPEGPSIIYWLWGTVTLIGFALNDFAPPRWDGLYWAIVRPVAALISWLIIPRLLHRHRVDDRTETHRDW